MFYSHFAVPGLNVTVGDASNYGRVDMVIALEKSICLFEFKVVEQLPKSRAMDQLKSRNYAAKYQGQNKTIYLIGVEFSRKKRNIVAFDLERTL